MNGSRRSWIFGTLLCAALNTGCATLDLPWLDRVPEASAKNPVVQILCLWEPSEGRDPDGMPCRGFAGQILFLGNKGGTPVKVEGDVRVYVFDDFGTLEEQALPLHQFDFKGAAWDVHLQIASMGPTYHVFIPYTRPGVHEANCALRVRLTQPGGATLCSNLSSIKLPGRSRQPESTGENPQVEPIVQNNRLPRTTTFSLDTLAAKARYGAPVDWRGQKLPANDDRQEPESTAPPEPVTTSQRIRFDGRKVERVEVEAAPPVESSRRPVSTQHPLFDGDAAP